MTGARGIIKTLGTFLLGGPPRPPRVDPPREPPPPTRKRTWVCFNCRTTQRKVGHVDLDVRGKIKVQSHVVCTSCREQMVGIPLAYAAAVPRKTNNRAWKLLEKSLKRPREGFMPWSRKKKLTNRKARRTGEDSQHRGLHPTQRLAQKKVS